MEHVLVKGRTPSLKDVAAVAGVSVTTISRLLNGSLDLPYITKKRIEDAIAALNYRPNPHARRLSMGRSDTIGLVVPLATLINRTGKVVVVDEDIPGSRVPKLFCDNDQGGHLAGMHLGGHGHKHVLFVGGDERMISTRRRYDGVLRGLREMQGDSVHVDRYAGEYTVPYGRAAALRFIEERHKATAIFASSDEIAIGMIEVFLSQGISIPRDVSIVGFDDVGPLHLFSPPLTVIRQPVRQIGRRSLELILETNWQESKLSASEELLPCEIVVRNSVAPPAK
jgi:LacI family transcriptional regulator